MWKWYHSKILRKLIHIGDWSVAIRTINGETLEKNSGAPFVPVANTDKYWFADPILFENNEKTWLFVEAFDKTKYKGELGVFEVLDGICQNYKTILEKDYHLSYPYIFKDGNNIYMLPESGNGRVLTLYKAVDFPFKWELDCVLNTGEAFRDSTPYISNNELYIFTYERTDKNRFFHTFKCYNYRFDIKEKKIVLIDSFDDINKNMRSAGWVSYKNGNIIRVSQKCDKIYGEGLLFWTVPSEKCDWKKASLLKTVLGKDVFIQGLGHPITIHTYSRTTKYEVIDYRVRK